MLSFSGHALRLGSTGFAGVKRTAATVVSGNKVSKLVRERLKKDVEKMWIQFPGFRPGLVVLQVGDRDDSNLYITMKLKAAAEIGISASHVRLPKTATEDEVLRCIVTVNENPEVHGLIVQLPLDSVNTMDPEKVINAVAPEKDVDGAEMVKGAWVKQGAVVIDCGINHVPGIFTNCLFQSQLEGCRASQLLKTQPLTMKLFSDTTLAHSCTPKTIGQLAREVGLFSKEVEPYGTTRAKVRLEIINRFKAQPDGKYVVVTGITPTPLGEGKATTTLGLAQALGAHLHVNSFACVCQPSQGSYFGVKGGGVGGGYSQVLPREEVHLYHSLGPLRRRSVEGPDSSPLCFRYIFYFSRGPCNLCVGHKHAQAAFLDCLKHPHLQGELCRSVASEVMAVLVLSTSLEDMRCRLARTVVAYSRVGNPVTTEDLGISGVLAALMREAVMPNLMQTMEGSPVFVHTCPLSDIAPGNSSILADQIALKLVGPEGFVVTEAGGGAETGMERFVDIKCRASGLCPDVMVMVASVRALKMHGGGPAVTAGSVMPKEYLEENLTLLENGCIHLKRQVENAMAFGLPVVVAINTFSSDTGAELELVCARAKQAGGVEAVPCSPWAEGGAGAVELGQAVRRAADTPHRMNFLYDLEIPIVNKIRTIARSMYGADNVELLPEAQRKSTLFSKQGLANLPVCMAKTHHDAERKGVPTGFTLLVRDVSVHAGAGFLYASVGWVSTEALMRPSDVETDEDLSIFTYKTRKLSKLSHEWGMFSY
uniref:C-1-tetrahydrofolate synthase, cytoplasmic n=1 Tax=Esox lucius TaxID=8010 RepID=A0A6Q2XIA9_ESOLU